MAPPSIKDLKFAILKAAAEAHPGRVHKINLIGRPYQEGNLERSLGIGFDSAQRSLAARAFEQLKGKDLIRATYSDLADPENWVEITDLGKKALEGVPLEELEAASRGAPTKEWDQKFGILLSPKQAERDFSVWAQECKEKGIPISLLFIDIDAFKALNTKHTETRIDETILPAIMGLLRDRCFGRGEAYRQGGDEFVVILPNCDAGEAVQFAERLRSTVEVTGFRVDKSTECVTVSIGIASWPANGGTYREILQAANRAKAEAKKTCNVVRVAEG